MRLLVGKPKLGGNMYSLTTNLNQVVTGKSPPDIRLLNTD